MSTLAERIAEMYLGGMAPKAIGQWLGIHRTTVHDHLRKQGIPPLIGTGNYRRTSEEKARLRAMVEEIRPDPETQKGKSFAPETQFGRGHTPWNKGRPWLEIAGENHPSRKDPEKYRLLGKALGHRTAANPLRGPAHPQWQGGKTALGMTVRNSPRYAEWRQAVYAADAYKCFLCGAVGDLNAHHIRGLADILRAKRVRTFEQALATPEIWDPTNGVTLCPICHPKANAISRVIAVLKSA